MLSVGLLVADVEPRISPPLDRRGELDSEISDIGVDVDPVASYIVDY